MYKLKQEKSHSFKKREDYLIFRGLETKEKNKQLKVISDKEEALKYNFKPTINKKSIQITNQKIKNLSFENQSRKQDQCLKLYEDALIRKINFEKRRNESVTEQQKKFKLFLERPPREYSNIKSKIFSQQNEIPKSCTNTSHRPTAFGKVSNFDKTIKINMNNNNINKTKNKENLNSSVFEGLYFLNKEKEEKMNKCRMEKEIIEKEKRNKKFTQKKSSLIISKLKTSAFEYIFEMLVSDRFLYNFKSPENLESLMNRNRFIYNLNFMACTKRNKFFR